MFALPSFVVRASIIPPSASVQRTFGGRWFINIIEKEPSKSLVLGVCVTYFHGQSPGNYRRRTCA